MVRSALLLVTCLLGCGRINYGALPRDAGMDAIVVDAMVGDSEAPGDSAADVLDSAMPPLDAVAPDSGARDSAVVEDASGDTVPDAPPFSCPGSTISPCPDVVRPMGMGDTVFVMGATNDRADVTSGTCGGVGAGEFVLQLDLASFGFYDISTEGSDIDTIVYVRDGDCTTGTEVACHDDVVGSGGETFTLGAGHAGAFFVIVDAADGQCGAVHLRVDG